MVIGLCDEQKEALVELKRFVLSIREEKGCDWELRFFRSGESLLKQIHELKAVFLNLEMSRKDGIEIGEEIRQRNPECRIIVAAGKTERFKEAFQIHALRFLTMPYRKEEVAEALHAVEACDLGRDTIEAYNMRNVYALEQSQIRYAQAFNGYTELMAGGKIFRKDISLNELETLLDERLFFRVHRQYIVNFRWICSYSGGNIEVTGASFPVSRRKKKEFEHKYTEYDLKYRRE